MANQHFEIDMTKLHGKKLAKLIRDAQDIITVAANLKGLADEVTAGGTELTAANTQYYGLFGMLTGDAAAGAALYPLLQSLLAGSIVPANTVEFDQGL